MCLVPGHPAEAPLREGNSVPVPSGHRTGRDMIRAGAPSSGPGERPPCEPRALAFDHLGRADLKQGDCLDDRRLSSSDHEATAEPERRRVLQSTQPANPR